MSRDKLVLINGRFLAQSITGVQRHAREVVTALTRLEENPFRFVIVTTKADVPDQFSGLEVIRDNSSLPDIIWLQVRLPLLMKKFKADLLWSPCNIGPLLPRNHIVTIHDASVFEDFGWFSKKFTLYYRIMLRLLGIRTRLILTDSDFSRRELIRHGVVAENKISTIKLGVDARFQPVTSRLFDYPYVLFLGSRDPRKNMSGLIEAWKRMTDDEKKGRKLVIAGGGAKSFSKEKVESIPSDVYFAGYVDDKDLPALYSGADAFVLPSFYEGFGLPPLEAMACGCPVVVSDAASLPEVCGDAAVYVDPYNVESISDGIRRVLKDDKLRKDMTEKGLERAGLFKWENTAREHLKVFGEVLGL